MLLELLDLSDTRCAFPFKASRFVLEPGSTSPPDEHAVAEIWLTAAGFGRLIYDESEYEMKPDSVFYMQPGAKHQAINTSSQPLEIFSIWWTP